MATSDAVGASAWHTVPRESRSWTICIRTLREAPLDGKASSGSVAGEHPRTYLVAAQQKRPALFLAASRGALRKYIGGRNAPSIFVPKDIDWSPDESVDTSSCMSSGRRREGYRTGSVHAKSQTSISRAGPWAWLGRSARPERRLAWHQGEPSCT